MNKICIYNINDLNKLRDLNKNKTYLISLERDLIMDNISFDPIDMEEISFIFNGNNHVIRNLYINKESENNIGFFSKVTSGVIKNIRFYNVTILGNEKVGVISGSFEGSISNVEVDGTVCGKYFVGSLIGESFVKAFMYNNSFNGEIIGKAFVGGVVGKGNQLEIINNVIKGNIYYKMSSARNTVGEFYGNTVYCLLRESILNSKPHISFIEIHGLVFF